MKLKNLRLSHLLVVVSITAAIIIWNAVIIPVQQRKQEYTGTITELSRQWRWWQGRNDYRSTTHHRYNHYWHIEGDDGEEYRIKLGYHRWKEGKPGLPVKKESGERWPVIDTPEYREQQQKREETKRYLLDQLFRSE